MIYFFLATTVGAASKILFLMGTSTSGKTTTINELIKKIDKFEDYGLDRRLLIEGSYELQRNYPDEYQLLREKLPVEDITRVAYGQFDLISQSNLTAEKKEQSLFIAKELYKKLCLNSQKNKDEKTPIDRLYPVILATLKDKITDGQSLIIDCTKLSQWEDIKINTTSAEVKNFLIFCPFLKLSQRMKIRNENALQRGDFFDLRQQRPLWQYASLYHKKKLPTEPCLEKLSRQVVEQVFDEFLQEPNTLTLSFIETIGLANHDKETFLSYLGFSPEDDVIEITTRFNSSDFFIIDTSDYNSSEIVNLILKEVSFS